MAATCHGHASGLVSCLLGSPLHHLQHVDIQEVDYVIRMFGFVRLASPVHDLQHVGGFAVACSDSLVLGSLCRLTIASSSARMGGGSTSGSTLLRPEIGNLTRSYATTEEHITSLANPGK